MIYAIGDIHGQHAMLRKMLATLDAIPLTDDDILLFLGDYIDRGENSREVIETLIALRERRNNLVFLRGNHEQLMLDACDGRISEADDSGLHYEDLLLWIQNGGRETLLDYGVNAFEKWFEFIPEAHWEFIRATEMEYVCGRYHFVHAGLKPPGARWEGDGEGIDPRLWIREPFLSSRVQFDGKVVVFGHTPQRSGTPLVQRNKIGIDTGAVFGGPLTAMAVEPNVKGRKLPPPLFYKVEHARTEGEPVK